MTSNCFRQYYLRIYHSKFLTLSNQMLCYKIKCIRIHFNFTFSGFHHSDFLSSKVPESWYVLYVSFFVRSEFMSSPAIVEQFRNHHCKPKVLNPLHSIWVWNLVSTHLELPRPIPWNQTTDVHGGSTLVTRQIT